MNQSNWLPHSNVNSLPSRDPLPRFSTATIALAFGLILNPGATLQADVTVSDTAGGGPRVGDGGTFNVSASGEIRSGGEGIVATGTSITALTIDGLVDAYSYGVNVNTGGSITSIGVSGTTGGWFAGLLNSGTVGSLTTSSGSRIGSGGGVGLRNDGTFTGTISNAGTIAGYGAGLENTANGQIFAVSNSGTVTGGAAVKTTGTLTTLTNLVGGSFLGDGYGVLVDTGGSVGTFGNAGSSTGYHGLWSNGAITTLNNSGNFTGGFQGIGLAAASTLGSFTNSGLVSGGGDQGMSAAPGSTIGTLTNSGKITGYNGFLSSAVTGTIRNLAGGVIEGPGNRGLGQYAPLTLLENAGSITGFNAIHAMADIGTIDNQAGGLIQGARGLYLTDASKTVTTITNAGTILGGNAIENYGDITTLTNSGAITSNGDWGIYHGATGEIGTLTNTATGAITGATHAIGLLGSGGTIDNAGLIQATNGHSLYLGNASLTQLTNSGTMSAGSYAVLVAGTSAIATTSNSGLISSAQRAIEAEAGTTIGTLTNSGTMEGGNYGVVLHGATGSLSNLAGARIQGTTNDAIYISGAVENLSNAGTISAADRGIEVAAGGSVTTLTNSGLVDSSNSGIRTEVGSSVGTITNSGTLQGANYGVVNLGTISKISNSGTISDTGESTGAAVFVGTNAVLGDSRGTLGAALVSTGAGALLDGTIVNQGTIHNGFTIGNQSVTVSAGGGIGSFNGGLLDVTDGDLTFTDGTLRLEADMSVNGGLGTVINHSSLELLGTRMTYGNFEQSPGASLVSIFTGSTAASLSIDGTATIGGLLNLELNGLSLAAGQTFGLLSFESYSGSFASLALEGLQLTPAGTGKWSYNSLILQENWTANTMSVSVSAVPEPGTSVGLALLLGSAMSLRRRERA